jgi:hypothetical protein
LTFYGEDLDLRTLDRPERLTIKNTLIFIVVLAVIGFGAFKASKARAIDGTDVRTVKQLPASVQNVVSQMDAKSQSAFFLEYGKRRKLAFTAYLLWIIGWHYLYCKKVGMQFAFWFTFGGLGFWWFIDIFRVPGIVSDTNSTIAREIVQTLSTGSAFRPTPQNFELLADPEGV